MEKTKDYRIKLCEPHLGQEEKEAVAETIDSGWIGPNGPHVGLFRRELENYFGPERQVLLTNSGTSALHLGLMALGVKAGDIVLVQSFSYAAPAFAVRYLGAEPIFIGSEESTWNMDPIYLAKAIEDLKSRGLLHRIKAIIPVHIYGNPANMMDIDSIAKSHDIPVFEDAAQAFGSVSNRRKVGSGPWLTSFSFNANKVLTTGGGGAVVSCDSKVINQLEKIANQSKLKSGSYDHDQLGYNYTMTNLNAAMGRVQLRRIDDLLRKRKDLFEDYTKGLNSYGEFQGELKDSKSNHWMSTILLRGKVPELFYNSALNIQYGHTFIPLHRTIAFQGSEYYGGEYELELSKNLLVLPSGKNVEANLVIEDVLRKID
ncbi:MAG: DegT/DnrJ/EryC1/StrS family aminotransferase [Bacteroidetes bacterium]|nr:DegT/DnrJ/EryC1/StrS family aminotransferase [Bacteroidota bacterium]